MPIARIRTKLGTRIWRRKNNRNDVGWDDEVLCTKELCFDANYVQGQDVPFFVVNIIHPNYKQFAVNEPDVYILSQP